MSEIEFGTKIVSTPQLVSYLRTNFKKGSTSSVLRKIYKKAGETYFFRITQEEIDDKKKYFFSLKEDLLSKGKSEGMKVSEEIDIEIDRPQLEKFTNIIGLLGYKLVNEIKKTRDLFTGKNVEITIDHYSDNDYLEVEGPTQAVVDSIVRSLPFTPLTT